MAHHKTVTLDESKLQFRGLAPRMIGFGVLLAIIGAALALGIGKPWLPITGPEPSLTRHFWHAYTVAYVFYLAITLGALFFTIVHHLARAGWSTTVRRIAEMLSGNIFLMAILFIPLIYAFHIVYPWAFTAPGTAAHKELLEGKSHYLTTTWVVIRCAADFLVWGIIVIYYRTLSARQDRTGDVNLSRRMTYWAPLSTLLYGLTVSLAAYDLLMSVSVHWYSTIFPIYAFAGFVMSALATLILITLWLKSKGRLGDAVNVEHYHDLGKLLFAFTFFWGYTAFAQFMLIWYAGLPDETQFFQGRDIGPWLIVSLVLLFSHLLIAWPGLLSRHVKRVLPVLSFWAVWMLIAQFIDMFWIIMPGEWINHAGYWGAKTTLGAQPLADYIGNRQDVYTLSPAYHAHMVDVAFPLSGEAWCVTIGCMLMLGGIYLISTAILFNGQSLVAKRDPRLHEALAFENI